MTDDPIAFRVMNEIGIIDQLGRNALERVLPHDLTMPRFIVLNHFVRTGKQRNPAELARIFQVSKGTMTSTLHRLEAKGFIEVKPDPRDGRGKRVAITEAGQLAREASISAIAPWLTRMQSDIGMAALSEMLPRLTVLRQHLDTARAPDLIAGLGDDD